MRHEKQFKNLNLKKKGSVHTVRKNSKQTNLICTAAGVWIQSPGLNRQWSTELPKDKQNYKVTNELRSEEFCHLIKLGRR